MLEGFGCSDVANNSRKFHAEGPVIIYVDVGREQELATPILGECHGIFTD